MEYLVWVDDHELELIEAHRGNRPPIEASTPEEHDQHHDYREWLTQRIEYYAGSISPIGILTEGLERLYGEIVGMNPKLQFINDQKAISPKGGD